MTASAGPRLGHLVLTVRDINASHRFYTEVLGFEQCGQLKLPFDSDVDMRFYRGASDAHHDLALVQSTNPDANPDVVPFDMFGPRAGVNHVAIEYPTRDAFLDRLRRLDELEIPIVVRGNHGMTHSAYIEDPDGNGIEVHYTVPSEFWEGDVDAALSHFEMLPSSGSEMLVDSVEYVRFG